MFYINVFVYFIGDCFWYIDGYERIMIFFVSDVFEEGMNMGVIGNCFIFRFYYDYFFFNWLFVKYFIVYKFGVEDFYGDIKILVCIFIW